MYILSWNLNGLKACLKRNDFKQLKALPLLDVICFQETKTKDRPMVIPGYHHHWYPSKNKKGYSGTLTLTLVDPYDIRYGIGVEDLDQEGRVLTVDMGVAYVVNTYVPNSQGGPERAEYRRKWDEAYHSFLVELAYEKPVIACGDYNTTLSRMDIYDENMRMDYAEAGYATDERSNLISLLEDGFVDAYRCLYPDKEDAFTWWSNRLNKREQDRGWRLDYFLVSSSIRSDIRDVVIHNNISGSDHCPITLEVDISDADI